MNSFMRGYLVGVLAGTLVTSAVWLFGCASAPAMQEPQTSEEWATYCMALGYNPDPALRKQFEPCIHAWEAWSNQQHSPAR